ncbi:cation-translocating P-type ATPase [Candidatus Pacearchaeota archaeon]|nr:cation-translocating P-type ATPase [Candidatus Pacearchaeota archaeon]
MKKVQITLVDIDDQDSFKVEQSLNQLSGVRNVAVNMATKTVTADCEDYIAEDQLISTIRQTGFQVSDIFFENSSSETVIDDENYFKVKQEGKDTDLLDSVVWAWVFAIPLIGILISQLIFQEGVSFTMQAIVLLISLPIVLVMGWKPISSGAQSFHSMSFDSNSLIFLSASVGIFTGVLSLFISITNYSGIAGVMMAIFLTGKYLEEKVRNEVGRDIRRFNRLIPDTAIIIIQGKEFRVPLSEIQVGDIMVLLPGDHIAADGLITKGSGKVDESLLTSEDHLIDKAQGDSILAGSVINSGRFLIEVTKIGKDTYLSRALGVVEGTQNSKRSIQRMLNSVAKYMVPSMIVLSVLTFVSWLIFTQNFNASLNYALAVLIITCPSSLGLAVPAVLFVGSGMAARKGILIRNGESFQIIKEAKTIIFDIPGTLTKGTPDISYITSVIKEKNLLEIAASMMRQYDTELANSLLRRAGLKRFKQVENTISTPGKGIEGNIDGKKIVAGNKSFFAEKSISIKGMGKYIQEYEDGGKKVLLISISGKVVGAIAVSDELKEDSQSTVIRLQKMNYKVMILVSDNERAGKALAKRLGNPEVLIARTPEEISKKISHLQEFGRVAFISGPNRNGRAIKQSNVGIVIGKEDDLGNGTEDILITKTPSASIIEIARLSKKVHDKVQQNLYWAIGYNVLAVPLAVLGYMHPIFAEMAMLASTISIFANANILRAERFY